MDGIEIFSIMTQAQQDKVESTFKKEKGRLLNFIKKSGLVDEEAEDILQDVFYQYIKAFQTIRDLERSTSWLFRVARNKITDYFRRKRPTSFSDMKRDEDSEADKYRLNDILPDLSDLPEDRFARNILWEAIMEALDELPEEQREVFIQHEFEEMSFQDMAEATGIGLNTLLSRKRYAILHLRDRLRIFYEEIK